VVWCQAAYAGLRMEALKATLMEAGVDETHSQVSLSPWSSPLIGVNGCPRGGVLPGQLRVRSWGTLVQISALNVYAHSSHSVGRSTVLNHSYV
jgi:hypothetical protein